MVSMPKLILRSNYFKNEPAVHRSNYIKYLGTREGVEMNPDTLPRFFYEDQDMHGKKENFIEYISDRPGAVHVDGTPHGLFSDRGLDINLEQVMSEVANHKGTVWINVISLKREDAARLECIFRLNGTACTLQREGCPLQTGSFNCQTGLRIFFPFSSRRNAL